MRGQPPAQGEDRVSDHLGTPGRPPGPQLASTPTCSLEGPASVSCGLWSWVLCPDQPLSLGVPRVPMLMDPRAVTILSLPTPLCPWLSCSVSGATSPWSPELPTPHLPLVSHPLHLLTSTWPRGLGALTFFFFVATVLVVLRFCASCP